jgi:flavodoxin
VKTLIICKSYHHMNTEKVAKEMAEVLGAKLATVEDVKPTDLADYDLIGFGSGIYAGKHHKALLEFAKSLPQQKKAVFIFSTCGSPTGRNQHGVLRDILGQRGFTVKGEFFCPGFDTFGPFKLIGGIKKGHPDVKDLEDSRAFAKSLMN